MIVWMLYSALMALIVAAAARGIELTARVAGRRLRWIWAGALVLTGLLSATAPMRAAVSAARVPPRAVAIGVTQPSAVDMQWLHAVAAARDVFSPAANGWATALWLLSSVALVLVAVGVGRRFRSARREWPPLTMHGVNVRVAPRVGPFVIGVLRPEIVVPRWLLARRLSDQQLVVAHEDEHVRARDPLVLSVGWTAVALTPWSPAVWYMLSRLRLAVEIDCDARVLRRGVAPQSYGSLLIDMALHASVLRWSAIALTDNDSHLRQRILAMKPDIPRLARLRAVLVGPVAVAGLVVACQARLPARVDADRVSVAPSPAPSLPDPSARKLPVRPEEPFRKNSNTPQARAKHELRDTTWTVIEPATPVWTTSEAPRWTVTPTPAWTTTPTPRWTATPAPTWTTTPTPKWVEPPSPTWTTAPTPKWVETPTPTWVDTPTWAVTPSPTGTPTPIGTPAPSGAPTPAVVPLFYIDGVRATWSDVTALDRKRIASVEVLKGALAVRSYGDADAALGVIVIRTKRGPQ